MRVLITYPDSFPGVFIKNKLEHFFEICGNEINYENYDDVRCLFKESMPDVVILNVPFSGGIKLNIEKPAGLITKNTSIQLNVIRGAFRNNIRRLIFIGSSCMYPKNLTKSLSEEDLLSGPLEETNLAYATAKILGWQMCKAFNTQYGTRYQTVIPANIYGEFEDFNEETSHVIGALISRFHKAKLKEQKEVTIWGTGKPVRDFLQVEDLADAIGFVLNKHISFDEINIGSGKGHSIKEIAETIARVVGYKGGLIFDVSKPDGMKVKVLNTEKMNEFGWRPGISLEEGIRRAYEWYTKK